MADSCGVDALVTALDDKAKHVRISATMALGEMGERRAVEPLLEALGHESREECQASAEALKRIGDPGDFGDRAAPGVDDLGCEINRLAAQRRGIGGDADHRIGDVLLEALVEEERHGHGVVESRVGDEALEGECLVKGNARVRHCGLA